MVGTSVHIESGLQNNDKVLGTYFGACNKLTIHADGAGSLTCTSRVAHTLSSKVLTPYLRKKKFYKSRWISGISNKHLEPKGKANSVADHLGAEISSE